jgi:hypothetical protein
MHDFPFKCLLTHNVCKFLFLLLLRRHTIERDGSIPALAGRAIIPAWPDFVSTTWISSANVSLCFLIWYFCGMIGRVNGNLYIQMHEFSIVNMYSTTNISREFVTFCFSVAFHKEGKCVRLNLTISNELQEKNCNPLIPEV